MISCILVLGCLSALAPVWCVTPLSRFAIDEQFNYFIQHHNKVYHDFQEREYRFNIFMENLQRLNEMGRFHHQHSFDFTPYMDHTLEEFLMTHSGLIVNESIALCNRLTDRNIPNINAPPSHDWTKYNVVTPVKDQKDCNSCYAFSATGNIEGQFAMVYKKLLVLSEQQIVDCDKRSHGCRGGYMNNAFSSLMELGGSELEADYPYRQHNPHPQCLLPSNRLRVKIIGCDSYRLSSQEKLKQLLYHRGPLSVAMKSEVLHMQNYKGQIIPDKYCTGEVNHGVLLVGYGEENGIKYWLLKNSWGTSQGDQGYFRLERGEGLESCGMMTVFISSAIVG
ncbi:cathepsin L1-like [Trichoplusia ni]|uniref:Cathepsin L1-like n=1 Tax=Trichoplusia ni TaxID=7111 RepID=A0A7E5VEN3_TRINI|nr:cathepsin L1-like [Trichoplusia ni]